jgi:hypothetical protein
MSSRGGVASEEQCAGSATLGGRSIRCALSQGHDGQHRNLERSFWWTKAPLYGCAKRGCDAMNPDYLAFGTRDGKSWCLGHIPLRARIRLWWQERTQP